MNFKEMEYILAVEQEKKLTKAARKIGISQPAMSKCLSNIETELGVSLFEKFRESTFQRRQESCF